MKGSQLKETCISLGQNNTQLRQNYSHNLYDNHSLKVRKVQQHAAVTMYKFKADNLLPLTQHLLFEGSTIVKHKATTKDLLEGTLNKSNQINPRDKEKEGIKDSTNSTTKYELSREGSYKKTVRSDICSFTEINRISKTTSTKHRVW